MPTRGDERPTPLTRVHEGLSFRRTRREDSALKGKSPVIMDSPILAGINHINYCTQAADAVHSSAPDVLLLASFLFN
jgi:hypothetical protein